MMTEMKVDESDLLIDAAVGTGLKRPYCAPHYSGPVLFGRYTKRICGLSGKSQGKPFIANSAITFQALKAMVIY